MELTYYTDYSLRTLMYLAVRKDRRCTVSEIASAYGISRNHLVKVVHGLSRGGFIRSFRGKGGGILLARAAKAINVGKVVRYTEGPLRLVECFRGRENRCPITPACGLIGALREASDSFLRVLDRYTLADLTTSRARLERILTASARRRAA
jgi:Rrf2 family transcriptional regulator, nitric oxide-sensitive transcriptional repressor